jgi:hypothetical protein
LSNAGTWFLGRLQTERDKARVIEGLEGASAEAGAQFDRGKMEQALAAMGKRVFLMNNVHDAAPTVFESRWALSYLAGPLTRGQIGKLMAERKAAASAGNGVEAAPAPSTPKAEAPTTTASTGAANRPLLSGDVTQKFWPIDDGDPCDGPITYRPALLGLARLHYVQTAAELDTWRSCAVLRPVDGELSQSPWEDATVLAEAPTLSDEPAAGAAFSDLPGALGQKKTYGSLKRDLGEWLYQTQRHVRMTCDELSEASRPDENEAAFRRRMAPLLQAQRKAKAIEARQVDVARLEKEIEEAEADRSEHRWWFFSLLANVGARIAEIVVTGLFGRRSRKQVMTVGAWNQAMKSRRLAAQAKKVVQEKTAALEKLVNEELLRVEAPLPPAVVPLTKLDVPPRKSDVDVDEVLLVWLPWRMASDGRATQAYSFPQAQRAGGE